MSKSSKLGKVDIRKLLFTMALPAILGQIVALLYNLVDRIFIGHMPEVGGLALTGVGLTVPIGMLLAAFSYLVGAGGAPLASIRLGQGKAEKGELIIGNCFTALSLLSILIMGLLFIFMEDLLYLFGASSATINYALGYLRIYTLGTPFIMLTIGLNPFITAQGFATKSMLTVTIGAIINIILDPIFIFETIPVLALPGLGMGVEGAALATIISQGVSAIWVLSFLWRTPNIMNIKRKNMGLKWKVIKSVMGLGTSPFTMNITESIIIIVFNTSLFKYGGDLAVGGMTIISSSMSLLFLPLSGLVQGAGPIMSYNYGARNKERMVQTFKYTLISALTYSTLLWAAFMLVPGFFASLFTSDQGLVDFASRGIRIFMAGSFILAVQMTCQHSFLALGQARISLFLAVLRKIILLVPLIYILPLFFEDKVIAVLFAEPVVDILATTVTALLFYRIFSQILRDMNMTPGPSSYRAD